MDTEKDSYNKIYYVGLGWLKKPRKMETIIAYVKKRGRIHLGTPNGVFKRVLGWS
jgi:hypothetical protein